MLRYASVRPFMYFDPPTLLRLFWSNFTSTCTYRPIRSPDFTKGRSKRVEVARSNYKKGRRYENGRSTEKVELMRTRVFNT